MQIILLCVVTKILFFPYCEVGFIKAEYESRTNSANGGKTCSTECSTVATAVAARATTAADADATALG